MVLNLENQINKILAHKELVLKYEETFPSNVQDIYELRTYLEDKWLNKYPFHTIFVRDYNHCLDFNYRDKAFETLLNIIIESYFNNIFPIIKKHETN